MKLLTLDKRFINVLVLFLLAYALVHLTYLALIYFCASLLDINEITYYFSYVYYDISNYKDWSRIKIIILFGLPSIITLLFAGIYWVAMSGFSLANSARQKLFFIWLILISLSFFLADMISAPFFRYGMAVVAEWLYLSREFVFGLSLFFWAAIPLIGYFSAVPFMKLANSRTYLRTKWTRLFFLLNTILLPFLLGSIIFSILIAFFPGYNLEFYFTIDFMRFLVLLLIILFILLFNFHKRYIGIKRTRDLEHISVPLMVFTVVSFVIIYFGLYFT